MTRFAKRALLPVQRAVWFLLDLRRDAMTPPRRLMNVGSDSLTRSDFHAVGREQMEFLVRVGRVKPDDKVLEPGCGVGRMAIQLAGYLSPEGSYRGFDIVRVSVDHCRQAITSRFPNFQFQHADVQNSNYNPRGTIAPQEFRFPYADESFSFVFLTSVFTHMQWSEVAHYMGEIRRVLGQGGRVLTTYFLLNPESEAAIRGGKTRYTFAYPREKGRVQVADDPDAAVAFDETFVRNLYADNGLDIVDTRYGTWSGRKTDVGFQDIIVAAKRQV
jgi:ubiquinone/menaquinone biosynthesis C-methylase UbiE